MEIEVEISRDELYRAIKMVGLSSFGQFKSTGTYKMLASLSIAVTVGLGASAITFIYKSESYDYLSFLLMIILFVGYAFLFRLITGEFTRFIVYNSKRYTGPVKIKLAEDCLYVQDGGITSRFKFGSFCKVEETKEFLLLHIDIHQAVIIPMGDEKTKELVALLRDRLKAAAQVESAPAGRI